MRQRSQLRDFAGTYLHGTRGPIYHSAMSFFLAKAPQHHVLIGFAGFSRDAVSCRGAGVVLP